MAFDEGTGYLVQVVGDEAVLQALPSIRCVDASGERARSFNLAQEIGVLVGEQSYTLVVAEERLGGHAVGVNADEDVL